jgi:hypothetical protein
MQPVNLSKRIVEDCKMHMHCTIPSFFCQAFFVRNSLGLGSAGRLKALCRSVSVKKPNIFLTFSRVRLCYNRGVVR